MAQATKTLEGQMYEVRKYGFITFETREEMEAFVEAGQKYDYAFTVRRTIFGWLVLDAEY